MIRVLVADDHEVIRKGVRAILTSRGNIEVCDEASNGSEAVKKAVALHPDLIILDLTMPVMGGFEAAVEIRKRLPNLPVLFFSIHEGAQIINEAKRIGVQGFVSKNRVSKELLEAVEALVIRKGKYFSSSDGVTALQG
jgi:DNA-binding NarL/FixJ family response regulator